LQQRVSVMISAICADDEMKATFALNVAIRYSEHPKGRWTTIEDTAEMSGAARRGLQS
jgi:hypothetical protein